MRVKSVNRCLLVLTADKGTIPGTVRISGISLCGGSFLVAQALILHIST